MSYIDLSLLETDNTFLQKIISKIQESETLTESDISILIKLSKLNNTGNIPLLLGMFPSKASQGLIDNLICSFIEQGGDIDSTTPDGYSAIAIATLFNNISKIDHLISHGANVSGVMKNTLAIAISMAHDNAIYSLIEHGVHINEFEIEESLISLLLNKSISKDSIKKTTSIVNKQIFISGETKSRISARWMEMQLRHIADHRESQELLTQLKEDIIFINTLGLSKLDGHMHYKNMRNPLDGFNLILSQELIETVIEAGIEVSRGFTIDKKYNQPISIINKLIFLGRPRLAQKLITKYGIEKLHSQDNLNLWLSFGTINQDATESFKLISKINWYNINDINEYGDCFLITIANHLGKGAINQYYLLDWLMKQKPSSVLDHINWNILSDNHSVIETFISSRPRFGKNKRKQLNNHIELLQKLIVKLDYNMPSNTFESIGNSNTYETEAYLNMLSKTLIALDFCKYPFLIPLINNILSRRPSAGEIDIISKKSLNIPFDLAVLVTAELALFTPLHLLDNPLHKDLSELDSFLNINNIKLNINTEGKDIDYRTHLVVSLLAESEILKYLTIRYNLDVISYTQNITLNNYQEEELQLIVSEIEQELLLSDTQALDSKKKSGKI